MSPIESVVAEMNRATWAGEHSRAAGLWFALVKPGSFRVATRRIRRRYGRW